MVGQPLLVIIGQARQILLAAVELLDPRAGFAFEPASRLGLGDDPLVDLHRLGGTAAGFLDLAEVQRGVDAPERVAVVPGEIAQLGECEARVVVRLSLLQRLADLLKHGRVVGELGSELAPRRQRGGDEKLAGLRAGRVRGKSWAGRRRARAAWRRGQARGQARPRTRRSGPRWFRVHPGRSSRGGPRGGVSCRRRSGRGRRRGGARRSARRPSRSRKGFRGVRAGVPTGGQGIQPLALEKELVDLCRTPCPCPGGSGEHPLVPRDDRRQRGRQTRATARAWQGRREESGPARAPPSASNRAHRRQPSRRIVSW